MTDTEQEAREPGESLNELVRLTCSVHLTLRKRSPDGPVGPTECIALPEILTRGDANLWVQKGIISPDCIVPLDLSYPVQ